MVMTESFAAPRAQSATPRDALQAPLFDYVLRLADSGLILAQRLGEWAGRAPILEEDIALTNVGLDLLGQARLWLAYAGEFEGEGRDEDALAFRRDAHEFRNALLAEQPNGDYAETTARQFLFDHWHALTLRALERSHDERVAAIGLVQLKYLDNDNSYRRQLANWYEELLGGQDNIKLVKITKGCESSRHLFQIRVKNRDALRAHLTSCDVGTEVYYPVPFHRQECFAHLSQPLDAFPHADAAAAEVLALPIYPGLTRPQQEHVVSSIAGFFA